jgi:hypothetical protein
MKFIRSLLNTNARQIDINVPPARVKKRLRHFPKAAIPISPTGSCPAARRPGLGSLRTWRKAGSLPVKFKPVSPGLPMRDHPCRPIPVSVIPVPQGETPCSS